MYAKATPAVSDILADAAHANPVATSPPAMPLLRLVRDESPVVVVWRGRTDGRVVRLPYQFYHAKVYAGWLVPRNPSVLLTGGLRRLDEVIAGYPQHLLTGVNAAALCHAYPCDRRTLERYFHFGAAARRPGRALTGCTDAAGAGKVIDNVRQVIGLTECSFEAMAGFVMM